jgi:hypothetical protein
MLACTLPQAQVKMPQTFSRPLNAVVSPPSALNMALMKA